MSLGLEKGWFIKSSKAPLELCSHTMENSAVCGIHLIADRGQVEVRGEFMGFLTFKEKITISCG